MTAVYHYDVKILGPIGKIIKLPDEDLNEFNLIAGIHLKSIASDLTDQIRNIKERYKNKEIESVYNEIEDEEPKILEVDEIDLKPRDYYGYKINPDMSYISIIICSDDHYKNDLFFSEAARQAFISSKAIVALSKDLGHFIDRHYGYSEVFFEYQGNVN